MRVVPAPWEVEMTRRQTSLAPPPTVQVTVRGPIPLRVQDYASRKIGHVARYSHEPVLHAQVVLMMMADPARQKPALAEASLDVNGTPVRAHVAAVHMWEALDLLEDRLRRQLVQLESRIRTRHRWLGAAQEHEWRHGDLPSARPEYFPRPVGEREVVRRKTFALAPQTPDEAAFDMELLGHDFYLFTDLSSGEDAVVYHRLGGGYGLRGDVGVAELAGTVSAVEFEGTAPTMTEQDAVDHLNRAGEPFVFYRSPTSGRGRVLYRRYDGHYGLITPVALPDREG